MSRFSGAWSVSFCCMACGFIPCCCSAARAWWRGSACSWWCRIFLPRCSTRICSIFTRAGCTCWASALPAEQCSARSGAPPCRKALSGHERWHARARSAISGLAAAWRRYCLSAVGGMMGFKNLTLRNALIAAHDALATAAALFVSLYLRFEGDLFWDRVPLFLRILPYFVIFSVVVCYFFKLTTTKWRFISLPDALNIVRVASVLTLALVVLDYFSIFFAPNTNGPVYLGRITIVLYFFLEVFFLSALRFAYRYFRYTRVRHHARSEGASPTLLVGRAADAEILLRGIESGAVKQLWPVGVLSPSAADRGQTIRDVPVLGGVDDVEDVIRDYERRGKPITRVVMTPSAFDPGARPDAVLMRAKRLGLIV